MEPPPPIQALGVNPFPNRFTCIIIRTVPRGDFAQRQWEEPITMRINDIAIVLHQTTGNSLLTDQTQS